MMVLGGFDLKKSLFYSFCIVMCVCVRKCDWRHRLTLIVYLSLCIIKDGLLLKLQG